MSQENTSECIQCHKEFSQANVEQCLCSQCEEDYCERCHNGGVVPLHCDCCNEGKVPCECISNIDEDEDEDDMPSCYICEGERLVTCPACNGQDEER